MLSSSVHSFKSLLWFVFPPLSFSINLAIPHQSGVRQTFFLSSVRRAWRGIVHPVVQLLLFKSGNFGIDSLLNTKAMVRLFRKVELGLDIGICAIDDGLMFPCALLKMFC